MADIRIKDLVVNRKAKHDYLLLDHFEAGLVLVGSEVKSLRAGQGNLQEAHVFLKDGSAFISNFHIATYEEANRNNHQTVRLRRLLLNRAELNKLARGLGPGGMTVVPLRIYLKGSLIKLEIALGKGKKKHDKRQSLKDATAKREMARVKRG